VRPTKLHRSRTLARDGLSALALLCSAMPSGAVSERIAPPSASIARGATASRTGTCPPGQLAYRDGTHLAIQCLPAPPCGAEQTRDADGRCVCPPGKVAVRHGAEPTAAQCVAAPPCADGQTRDAQTGECRCPTGQIAYRSGSGGVKCVAACPPGRKYYRNGAGGGACVP
jgi:hypothetical protein